MNNLTDVTGKQNCVLCHANGCIWLRAHDRTLMKCNTCGFLWVTDGVSLAQDGKSIYETDSPIFLQQGNDAYYLDETNTWSCRQKLNWIKQFLPPGVMLLDVGANFGHFLHAAKGDFAATGLELSPVAAQWGKDHFGVPIDVGSVHDLASGSTRYDAVTCWDVIEHLTDPIDAIDCLRESLTGNGHLFLSTPDSASLVAGMLGRRWHYLDLVQHTALFGHKNLAQLLTERGFRIIARRSFGHYYRVQYIMDRLQNLHEHSVLRGPSWVARQVLKPFRRRSLYVGLGDVMGIAAQRC